MRKVNENLEILRASKGISKKHLAQSMGMEPTTCYRMLWGEVKIPADTVPAFAKALGITDLNIIYNDDLTDSVTSNHIALS